MNERISKNKDSKKNIKRKIIRWLVPITILFTIAIFSYLWYEGANDVNDLSLIGKGENIIVQIHDPGWGSCRELKRVVNSLKPEYTGKIRFILADLNSREGRWFAEYHNVSRVTLLFFKPDGTKITSLSGELDAKNLRNVFDRVFEY